MSEYFFELDDYPGYGVSELGNVIIIETGQLCEIWKHKDGYRMVKNTFIKVGKEVLKRFKECPNIPGVKFSCDHINRDRSDDRIENLRWATKSTQMTNKHYPLGRSNEKYIHIRNDRFMFVIKRENHKHSKYFDTLEQAVIYRDQYIQKHNL